MALVRVLMMALVLISVSSAFAQDDSEEARQNAEKAKRRHYAGGKDEQELTVQATLPSPTRYPQDVTKATGAAKPVEQEDARD